MKYLLFILSCAIITKSIDSNAQISYSKKDFTKNGNNQLMFNYEVSVNEYLEFVKSKNTSKELWYNKNVFIDTTTFGSQIRPEFVFENYYSNNNNFSNFPIVGVSSAQAEEFCKWLTQKLNLEGSFKGKIKEVRLPTLSEYYSVLLNDTIKAVFTPKSDSHKFDRTNEMDVNMYTNLSSIDLTKTVSSKGFSENLSGLEDGYVYMAPVNTYSGNGCVNLIGNVSEFVYSDDSRNAIIPIGNNFSGQIIYHGKLSNPEYTLYDTKLLLNKNNWEAPSAKIGFRFVIILN